MKPEQNILPGIRWTTLSSLGRAILQFGQIGILAHQLPPSDFGLIALVITTMAFIQVFADAGISNAIIHYQNISQQSVRIVFQWYWVNLRVRF